MSESVPLGPGMVDSNLDDVPLSKNEGTDLCDWEGNITNIVQRFEKRKPMFDKYYEVKAEIANKEEQADPNNATVLRLRLSEFLMSFLPSTLTVEEYLKIQKAVISTINGELHDVFKTLGVRSTDDFIQ